MDRCWPDAPSSAHVCARRLADPARCRTGFFFETQPFLANESPNRTPIGLDPALRQFGRQAPRREPTGMETMTQPDGDVSRERARLAPPDRSRRNRTRAAASPISARKMDRRQTPCRSTGLSRPPQTAPQRAPANPANKVASSPSLLMRTLNQSSNDLGIPIPSENRML